MSIAHGTILGGLSTVPDLDEALRAYRDTLGLELAERGELDADLAQSWGCPGNAGSPYAVLRPASAEPCWMRLVEQPAHPGFRPTRSYGWAAFECTVEDVWHWPDAIPPGQFEIVGPPKVIENIEPAFIPMQVLGPGREMVYLNQVLADMPGSDLPRAKSPVDRIFIVVLAAPDREASVEWYRQRLHLDRGADFTIPYTMINNAFGLSPDTQTTLTMVSKGRMPIVEVDDYPAEAAARPRHEGLLPPGNALVTLAVQDLDACELDWIAAPASREGALYEGRRAATTLGPAGELLELVECKP
ncbi:VOC family protein [Paraurantiacibacter namhicola]|uniref:Glyoxalase-like domain protein n=1 Tax=Paraurantiacibacter namhicola TaxID=645517 RepID=A0A1C7D4I7_9SPHN|nr:VOC family protein [Paraurantiacibacter namhicola]ANU06359.1 Glyoxalase-like domain protein [Paraurantiacibacter namhicola]